MDTTIEFLLDRAGRAEEAADRHNLRALDAEDRAAELEDKLAAAETRIDELLSRAFDAEADANLWIGRTFDEMDRARRAETRAAAWWEAAKAYCREVAAQAASAQKARNQFGEALRRAEAAESDLRNATADLSAYQSHTWTDYDGTVRPIPFTRAQLARKLYDENERAGRIEQKYQAIYADFAAAAFEWEESFRAMRARCEKAEWLAASRLASANEYRARAERAEARLSAKTEPKPRAFRDSADDVWVEVAPDVFTVDKGYDRGRPNLSSYHANETLDEIKRWYGPLTEITEG